MSKQARAERVSEVLALLAKAVQMEKHRQMSIYRKEDRPGVPWDVTWLSLMPVVVWLKAESKEAKGNKKAGVVPKAAPRKHRAVTCPGLKPPKKKLENETQDWYTCEVLWSITAAAGRLLFWCLSR